MMRLHIVAGVVVALALEVSARGDEAEERAVAAIEKMGGRVTRDKTAPGLPVIHVDLSSGSVTEAGLKEVAGLKQLKRLNLRGTGVTAGGLKELAGHKQL